MAESLLPTTVVGSYPQPDWLIDRDKLTHQGPVRVRAQELWRVPEPWLEAAQDDATLIAIRDMQRAGIDIFTDGEIRAARATRTTLRRPSRGVDLNNRRPCVVTPAAASWCRASSARSGGYGR